MILPALYLIITTSTSINPPYLFMAQGSSLVHHFAFSDLKSENEYFWILNPEEQNLCIILLFRTSLPLSLIHI